MKQVRLIPTFLFSFVSIFTSLRFFSKYLGSIDFMNELSSNEALARSDDHTKSTFRENTIRLTIERGKRLRTKSLISVAWISFASILALAYGYFINQISFDGLIRIVINYKYQFLSIFFFSLGTLGRIGWAGQSYSGNTVYERLDMAFLWITYFIGVFTGLISLL